MTSIIHSAQITGLLDHHLPSDPDAAVYVTGIDRAWSGCQTAGQGCLCSWPVETVPDS